jgi:hypothetical protein
MTNLIAGLVVIVILLIVVWNWRKKLLEQATPAVRQAVLKQADSITLARTESPQWRQAAAIEGMTNELAGQGFSDAGTFTVDKMPGVLVRILVNPGANVSANLYDHPQGGTWAELVTRYEDGSAATATGLPSKGVPRPDWLKTMRFPGASATQLYRELVQGRPSGAMKPAMAANAAQEFEQGYLSYMVWLKNRDLSSADVLRMVQGAMAAKKN